MATTYLGVEVKKIFFNKEMFHVHLKNLSVATVQNLQCCRQLMVAYKLTALMHREEAQLQLQLQVWNKVFVPALLYQHAHVDP